MSLSARRALPCVALALALALPLPAGAQIRASEAGTVSQTVDGTVIALEYSRPRLRGRTGIFGSPAVHWGETWTPGANWATTLDLNRDVTIEGQAVPKGRYSMWFVVRQSGDWSLLLDAKAHRYHMEPPDTAAAAYRIPVHPARGAPTEVLTWSFPDVQASGATLAFQWDTVRIPLRVRVTPSLTVTTPEAEARAYLGTYDTTSRPRLKRPRLVVTYQQGTLIADLLPAHPYFQHMALIRVGPDMFVPGLYENGEIYEVMRPDLMLTFSRANGRMMLEVRNQDDELLWSGARAP